MKTWNVIVLHPLLISLKWHKNNLNPIYGNLKPLAMIFIPPLFNSFLLCFWFLCLLRHLWNWKNKKNVVSEERGPVWTWPKREPLMRTQLSRGSIWSINGSRLTRLPFLINSHMDWKDWLKNEYQKTCDVGGFPLLASLTGLHKRDMCIQFYHKKTLENIIWIKK